jgi:predicted transcriptional regulator
MAGSVRKSIFVVPPDAAAEAELDATAEADLAAGRVVPHAEVAKWLESWGTEHELPCPKVPRKR